MKFIKKNWRILCGTYIFIYMPWFLYLERTITADSPNLHIVNHTIDNLIPFCRFFIIPYYMWFAYVFLACIFMYFKATDKEYLAAAITLIAGMSICLGICTIYPNGLSLRPANVPDDIFGRLTMLIYASDTPTNVFPSIHVYNSLAVDIALRKCEALKNHKVIKNCSTILCILICMSTVFVKQHSVFDVIGGFALMGVMYFAVYVRGYKRLERKGYMHTFSLEPEKES